MKTRKKKALVPSEDQEQMALVKWLNLFQIPFYHVTNKSRNVIEGRKHKLMGVQSGIPDICIPVARKCYHSLYIELKRVQGGVVSDNQKEWISRLRELGCAVFIAYGCEEAIRVIKEYFA